MTLQPTMMDYQLTLIGILNRAGRLYKDTEVVSSLPDKSLHRYSYKNHPQSLIQFLVSHYAKRHIFQTLRLLYQDIFGMTFQLYRSHKSKMA